MVAGEAEEDAHVGVGEEGGGALVVGLVGVGADREELGVFENGDEGVFCCGEEGFFGGGGFVFLGGGLCDCFFF